MNLEKIFALLTIEEARFLKESFFKDPSFVLGVLDKRIDIENHWRDYSLPDDCEINVDMNNNSVGIVQIPFKGRLNI